MHHYRTALRNYAAFSGRARRREFWTFVLVNLVVMLALSVVDVALVPVLGVALLSTVFSLAVLVPTLAVGARRLHDVGRTGWLQAGVVVPAVVFALLPTFDGVSGDGSVIVVTVPMSLLLATAVLVLVVSWLSSGTAGPNRYGPAPAVPAAVR